MDASMIRQIIRSRKQELVDLAAAFIRIPSENPSVDFEKWSAEIGFQISRYLGARGFKISEHESNQNKLVTVIGETRLNRIPGPRLLLCGHTDVVPAGDPLEWTFDPYSGEVRDGMLLGRGASDMKGGMAALVFVAGLLQEFAFSLNLKGSLALIASPDEEDGGIEVASLLEEGMITGDACLIGEPTHTHHPNIGEKAMAWMQITIPGEADHGSRHPVSGVSAVKKGATVVQGLARLWDYTATPPRELQQLLYHTEWFLANRQGNPMLAHLLYRPSFNTGIMRGGTKVNVVADSCTIEVDIRVPFGMRPEFVYDFVRNLVHAVSPDAVIEPMVRHNNPNWTSENSKIVQAVEEGIRTVLGKGEPVFSVLLIGSSDASHFRNHGIDTILYGPGIQDTIHGYDEQVSVENLVQCAEVFAEAAIRYLTE
ncbi:ArgE/DapE family deacylase [Oceanobacillus luteolus]|uniref:Probable succinyl-diaminopimelate desuccinylase n=1 Tax=Oceanobacillus luteolus TaxID=1274358 RepID=A0ABW4HT04_9BACI|nr:ArgE/DapE family deacylase [Oceanobacillus luteolus]MCM3742180.1 ArgE/DapE family deacylase [Oceanobacillus luteolus]